MESSRTHFEVLGLKAYKSLKMPCPRLSTALFFELLKTGQGHNLFFYAWNFAESLRFFARRRLFFRKTSARCVLGPWPQAFLSLASRGSVLESRFLPWPRIFFVSLTLASSPYVFSTPSLIFSMEWKKIACIEYGKIIFHSSSSHTRYKSQQLGKIVWSLF